MTPKTRISILTLATCLSAAILYWIDQRTVGRVLADPDRYLHLSINRMLAESGQWALDALPQVHGLGWDKFFPDKEPLFHTIGALLHRIGGEPGSLLLPWISSTAVLLAMALRIRLTSRAGAVGRKPILKDPWLLALVISSIGFFSNPNILFRFNLMRSHTLGVAFFLLLDSALLIQSSALSFLASLLFALSYHAFYLPLLLLACHLGAQGIVARGRTMGELAGQLRGCVGWGVLGILSGLILSPSFPGNVSMTWRVMQIALFEVGSANLTFGGELYPINTLSLLRAHGGFLAMTVVLAFGFGRARKWAIDELRPALAIAVFWVLMLKSPRAGEYLLPLMISLVGSVLLSNSELAVSRREKIAYLLLLLSPLVHPTSLDFYSKPGRSDSLVTPTLLNAMRTLPEERPRFFNIDWDISPQLIYANPKITVVDVLDPSLLLAYDRDLHEWRTSLIEGRMPDVTGFLTKVYQADYIATVQPRLIPLFDRDPTLIRIFPTGDTKPDPRNIAIYRIQRASRDHFVTAYENLAGVDGLNPETAVSLNPRDSRLHPLTAKAGMGVAGGPTYLDGGALFPRLSIQPGLQDGRADQIRCFKASPSPLEISRSAGSTVLGIGGGSYLRIWLNGKKLYNSITSPSEAALVHQLVRLPRPMAPRDQLEVVACSQVTGTVLGIALSTWNDRELITLCKAKQRYNQEDSLPALSDALTWPQVGSLQPTCIGALAREQ